MKFLNGIFGPVSGSVGGVTASRNKFGGYLKTKPNPVNPNSERQQSVRNTFAALAEQWSNSLTQDDRDAWDLYAANVTFKDSLGQDINLSGFNVYIRTNTVAVQASVAQIDAGPGIFTLAESDDTMAGVADAAGQQVSVSFDDTLAWLDEDDACMALYLSIPANGSRRFIEQRYRFLGTILGDGTTPLTSPQVFDSPWVIAEGQQVITRGRILRADGRLSEPFLHTSVVTA